MDLPPIPIPITLYVETINFKPELDTRIQRRKSAIDIEMQASNARQLLEELTRRLEENSQGAIRVRFTGRLFV